jgi:hypothetical protein
MKRTQSEKANTEFRKGLARAVDEAKTFAETKEEFCQGAEQNKLFDYSTEERLTELENCTDILPARVCDALGIKEGASYSDAVRVIRKRRKGEVA